MKFHLPERKARALGGGERRSEGGGKDVAAVRPGAFGEFLSDDRSVVAINRGAREGSERHAYQETSEDARFPTSCAESKVTRRAIIRQIACHRKPSDLRRFVTISTVNLKWKRRTR